MAEHLLANVFKTKSIQVSSVKLNLIYGHTRISQNKLIIKYLQIELC